MQSPRRVLNDAAPWKMPLDVAQFLVQGEPHPSPLITATLTEGQVIDFGLYINAQHGGRHWFSVCPSSRQTATQACFDLPQNQLTRADGSSAQGKVRLGASGVWGLDQPKLGVCGHPGVLPTCRNTSSRAPTAARPRARCVDSGTKAAPE